MTPRYRILVVDDEPLARERIRRLLANRPDCEVRVSANAVLAAEAIEREKPDIIFLDIKMPGMDGFDLVSRLGPHRQPVIIFVTAYDQHAVRAFEAQALDYLVKPFDDARFEASITRAKAAVTQTRLGNAVLQLANLREGAGPAAGDSGQSEPAAELEYSDGLLDRVLVRDRGRLQVIPIAQIDWVGADGNYVRIHAGKEGALHRSTIAEFESRLDPKRFVRIHRSAIVNLERVRELREYSRGEYMVLLTDGTRLKISRARRARLQQLLSGSA